MRCSKSSSHHSKPPARFSILGQKCQKEESSLLCRNHSTMTLEEFTTELYIFCVLTCKISICLEEMQRSHLSVDQISFRYADYGGKQFRHCDCREDMRQQIQLRQNVWRAVPACVKISQPKLPLQQKAPSLKETQ